MRSRLPAGSKRIQYPLGILSGLIVLIAFAVLLSVAIQTMRRRRARRRLIHSARFGETPLQPMPWK